MIFATKTEAISVKSKRRLKQILAADLVIIDEIGFLPVSRQEANMFFQLISNLYRRTLKVGKLLPDDFHIGAANLRSSVRIRKDYFLPYLYESQKFRKMRLGFMNIDFSGHLLYPPASF